MHLVGDRLRTEFHLRYVALGVAGAKLEAQNGITGVQDASFHAVNMALF